MSQNYPYTLHITHIVYWLQCNLNALNTEIKEHSDTYTHNTLNNNHLRTLKEQYSKSAKEKRMITLLRVYPWAFCDYGYLFVAEWYSQSQNECKYWSLSGYENLQASNNFLDPASSKFFGSASALQFQICDNRSSFKLQAGTKKKKI